MPTTIRVTHRVEGFPTRSTLVFLFRLVGEQVILVVAFLMEALMADVAAVGSDAGVQVLVRFERGAAVESFAADVAHVRSILQTEQICVLGRKFLAEKLSKTNKAAALGDEGQEIGDGKTKHTQSKKSAKTQHRVFQYIKRTCVSVLGLTAQ